MPVWFVFLTDLVVPPICILKPCFQPRLAQILIQAPHRLGRFVPFAYLNSAVLLSFPGLTDTGGLKNLGNAAYMHFVPPPVICHFSALPGLQWPITDGNAEDLGK